MKMLIPTCALLLLLTIQVYSQQRYIIQHYTNENGLPANGVKGIELDRKNGFLWVGTQAGLVRFDGANFRSFTSGQNSAVSRSAHLAKSRNGDIYCEDDNFLVYRIINNKPEWVTTDTIFYPFFQSKAWQTIYQSVNRLKDRLKNHQRSDFPPPSTIYHEERGDSSFSFINFGHIYHYSAANDSFYHFPGFVDVLKIERDIYFVDSSLGLWWYNDSLKKPLPVQVKGMPNWKAKKTELPRYLWKAGMKEPLFMWQQDIWKLQGRGDVLQLEPVCLACCPRNADINSVQIWAEKGLIFLGSAVNGLYVVKTPFIRSIRADTTVEAGQAEYSQAEISPGVVITGSGLSFTAGGQLLPAKKIDVPFHPQTMFRDSKGDHWFHSGDTIIHFHHREGHYSRTVLNDGTERMTFSEINNRLFVFSEKAIGEITQEQYRPLFKFPYSSGNMKNWQIIHAVAELKPGLLAIATEKLMLFDIEKRTAPDTVHIPGLHVPIRALHKFNDYLLIGTYGQGFYMYKNGVVKKMPLDKNGYLSYTHCFMPDTKGFCWMSTNHGLFKVSLNALVTAYENNLPEIYYHYLGKDDGMYNTELNGGCQPCGLQLSNGLFSFPTMNGMVLFDPLKNHNPPPEGQIFIEEVLADSVLYAPGDSSLRSLSYRTRNLRFKLALPRFCNAENIYFSYKLEPYNNAWETHDIVQNNILQFGGLPPGDYTLYVRVRNGFEPDQFGITRMQFRIETPWYQRWWFVALMLLGLIALIWGLVKWRTARITKRKEELQQQVAVQTKQLASQLHQLQGQQQKLEEDNKIKARLIGIISHDMISPIRFMGYLAKKMRDGVSNTEPTYQTIDAFVNVSQDLESLSVNMLNWIRFHHGSYALRPEPFDLHELVNESTAIAAALAKEKGISLHNDVPGGTRIWQYRQAIGVIVYNLAMNAMKYSEAGEIRVKGFSTETGYAIMVTDTGIGMSPGLVNMLNNPDPFNVEYSTGEIKKFQFGYLIIKDLLQLVEGDMKVESDTQKGTKVTIRFAIIDK